MNVKHHGQSVSITTGQVWYDGMLPVYITSTLEYEANDDPPVREQYTWTVMVDPGNWCGDPLQMVQNLLHRLWLDMRYEELPDRR